jgi:hypothetical protein
MNIIYILYNSNAKLFFLNPNKAKENNVVTQSVFTIKVEQDTLPDLETAHYLIRKDVFQNSAIEISDTNHILSFSTIPYNGEQNFLFVVDVTEYSARKEKPNLYPIKKEQLLHAIGDIRALAIYARFSEFQKV